MADKIDFFKHRKEEKAIPPPPTIPDCDGCLDPANPAWRDNGLVYCRECAPPELKNAGLLLKDKNNDNPI